MKGIFTSTLLIIFFPALLFAQHSITGRVLDENDQALIGAVVELTEVGKSKITSAVTTSVNGRFNFSNVAKGKYYITIKHVSYNIFKSEVLRVDQNIDQLVYRLQEKTVEVKPLIVEASQMANERAPKTQNTYTEEDLIQSTPQDVPMLLNQAPSLTFTSDAGNGVGYTGLRIRGMDQNRINVTVNGIPINDQESQGVFWVNMPDLASSSQSIQVQRGVGTSTNGGQAFGASVNIQTDPFDQEAGASFNSAFGSFNTYKINGEFNSGLMKNGWAFQARLSKMGSDGFIDRATSDLKSYYFSAARMGERSTFRVTAFSGKERTYQAWYGVSEAILDTNRTYNPYTYENQVDNYQQDHYQLHYDIKPFDAVPLQLSTALHYTRGRGYFEEYEEGESFADYGFAPLLFFDQNGDSNLINSTDLIRRRWLDNHFLGGVYAAKWQNKNWIATLGGNYNQYFGDHFGEVIWARYASDSEIEDRYYENDAYKRNWNNYLKIRYSASKYEAQAEVQVRSVHYAFQGITDDLREVDHSVDWLFVNPKASFYYLFNDKNRAYAYYGRSNREPVRNDFVEVAPEDWPQPETVDDIELGYEYQRDKLNLTANLYYMHFSNQLVPSGELNDVGAYLRVNVPESFRRGVELQAQYQPFDALTLNANATFSQNQIVAWTNYVEDYDSVFNDLGQKTEDYQNTAISFSPQIIGFLGLRYQILSSLSINTQTKYVGQQYLDNTESENRMLDPYTTTDVIVRYELGQNRYWKNISINAMVFNVFNERYESNGWTWSYIFDGERVNDNHYYPQAGRNYMVSLVANF